MNRYALKVPLLAALFLSAATARTEAHAFRSGADFYEQFLEGASVILAYPGTLLPVMAIGILAGLWDRNGMVRAWPAFAAGLVLGMPLSALIGPAIAIWLIALGVLTASLAALLSQHNAIQCLILSFLTGLLAMMVSLEGHGLFELAGFIYVGIFVAANIVFVATANVTRMTIEQFRTAVTSIAFRVFASWIAAMLLLFLAFEWRG